MPPRFLGREPDSARCKQGFRDEERVLETRVGRSGNQRSPLGLRGIGRDADGGPEARSAPEACSESCEFQKLARGSHVAQHTMLEWMDDLERSRDPRLIAASLVARRDERRCGIISLEAA